MYAFDGVNVTGPWFCAKVCTDMRLCLMSGVTTASVIFRFMVGVGICMVPECVMGWRWLAAVVVYRG